MKMDAFDWVMLITLATVWGGSFLFNAILVAELPVITIVAIRVTVAALALWGFVRVTGRKIPTAPKVWGALLILGVLNNTIPFSLIVQGQTQITSGLASILNAQHAQDAKPFICQEKTRNKDREQWGRRVQNGC